MSHLTELQIEEWLSGEVGVLRRFAYRHHIAHCVECRAHVEEVRGRHEAERAFAEAVQSYQEAKGEAEATLRNAVWRPQGTQERTGE